MAKKEEKREFEFLTTERLEELRKRGWSDAKIASFIFMVNSEGGPKEEDLYYKTPERVVEVFEKNEFFKGLKTFEEKVQKVKNSGVLRNPELFGNTFYGNRLGNTGGKDGYAFRGRGNVQMTGRNNYQKVGELMGVDLVSNPDLVSTDPKIQWTSGAVFVDMNDKNNKAITPRQMHALIRPATTFEESMKRGRIPSIKELDEIAKRNDAFNAVKKISEKVTPKTPTPKNLPPPSVVSEPEERVVINDEVKLTRKPRIDLEQYGLGLKNIITPADENLKSGKISLETWYQKKLEEQEQRLPPPDFEVEFPK